MKQSHGVIAASVVVLAATLGLAGCSTSSSNNADTTRSAQPFSKDAKYLSSATASLKSNADPKVEGAATMTLDTRSHDLTVVADVSHLVPGGKYEATIQDSKTHKLMYNLQTVTADKTGSILIHSVLRNVKSLPASESEIVVSSVGTKEHQIVVSGQIVGAKK